MKRLIIGTEAYLPSGLLTATLATLVFLLFAAAPPSLFSGVTLTVIGCGVFLFGLLFIVSALQRNQALNSEKGYLRLVLVVWWSLLVSEQPFFRHISPEEAVAGHFSASAYGEAAFWALAFLALFLMPRPKYLRDAFSGSNKWLSLFAFVCLASTPFSPMPIYSLAWAFKLVLVVVLLLQFSATIHDLNDIEGFFWATFWGFVLATVVPVTRAFVDPSIAFKDGRLNESLVGPTGLALAAGTLVLLSLTLNSLRNRSWLLGFALLGAAVMIMSGGKAGTIAGLASVTLFYILQKRIAAGFGWLMGAFGLGCFIFAVTPLSTYFTAYQEQGQLSTLTGRTELWRAVRPEIISHPILGHGYLASKFVPDAVEVPIEQTGNMENGFLEALYNNGLVGLIVLIVIHLSIVRALWRVLKSRPNRNILLLGAGCWAIYINLLIAGQFNSIFGGAARPQFMLLLGLVVVSEALRRNAHQAVGATK